MNEIIKAEQAEKSMEELRKAAAPLVELLRKKYTPRATAIVTDVHAEITSWDVGVSFFDAARNIDNPYYQARLMAAEQLYTIDLPDNN